MQLLRFDDGPSTVQAMLSGQIDAMGGGDYGEIYLRKGRRARNTSRSSRSARRISASAFAAATRNCCSG